ncbi:leucyl/phenylalanyl-tRNA--protein transferase [Microbulbifer yueqingensis]|uniref:Leucyl/phenylalanyl-tRNA--protein transferase n=1 Tax=Microbulbifer yueqingensis TaxID=658219 RepID=A0A1G8ZSE9_9GAMM|nr:leucyl/phenylalanyl-tRNA--protein transferase [Microbulbifer yueqingensis]SDK17275.1 leucyl/phenylalanyl-tRNA--protein transferase [Microbulbifer yueqingensis]
MTGNSDEHLTLLHGERPNFPPTRQALHSPNGLLAVGGRLTPEWLLAAYRRGIFPWYSDDQPILWWSPSPRCVVLPEQFSVGRTLRKTLRRGRFSVTFDRDFDAVISACSEPRVDGEGTWITSEMRAAYRELHRLGHAHSVEAWEDGQLAGGLYGVAIGHVFFGESMFHRATDASKIAFVHLVRQLQSWGCPLIDCQVSNPHLASLGAVEIGREEFERRLAQGVGMGDLPAPWEPTWNLERDL